MVQPVGTLTPQDFCQVGLRTLAVDGVGAVTVANVCRELDVSKGSFYHHFESAHDLHRRMLEHWEDVYGRERVAAIEHLAPLDRLAAQFRASLDRDHEVESAIRAWARTDPVAAGVQQRLDVRRITFTTATLAACGLPRPRARRLAQLALATLVGFQTMSRPVDRRALREASAEMQAWLLTLIADAGVDDLPAAGRSSG